jgi:putative ABC transport system permease protein
VLVARLVIGDVKRRRVQSVLLLVMIAAATATLTLALALRGVTDSPFARTQLATNGPDVVASLESGPGGLRVRRTFRAIRTAPGVVAASGPYPVVDSELSTRGATTHVQIDGRGAYHVPVDQPLLVAGRWVDPGGVVLERSLASALGVHVGARIRIGRRHFIARGIALSTAQQFFGAASFGTVWATRHDTLTLAGGAESLGYSLNLKLADPAAAPAFAREHTGVSWGSETWQEIRANDNWVTANEQRVLEIGSALLAVIAIASIAVLVGGRMAEQTRRVGLLKAVGGTPALLAVVLLCENAILALAATVVGVIAGALLAPTLTSASAGMLGASGAPALTPLAAVLATLLALAVAGAATVVPAVRGARRSTINALQQAARPPHRVAGLIAFSARLPAPLLLAVRLAARRPYRTVLAVASGTIAVAAVVATLTQHHSLVALPTTGSLANVSSHATIAHVATVLSIILVTVATINILFTTWVTVLDAQKQTAVARALGATPNQVAIGLAATQLTAALIAAALGIPAGLALYGASGGNLTDGGPPLLVLLATIPAALITVGALTTIPAELAARRPVADVLRSE